MHAVIAGEGGEAEVGDDEPLRRLGIVVLARLLRRLGDHDVDAGLQRADRVGDGERRGDFLVQLLRHVHGAGEDLLAGARLDLLQLVALQLALEIAALERADEVAVADAVDLDLDLGGVDRNQRDALLATARQHVGLAGEAHERLAVGHVDGDFDVLRQILFHRGRQAGADLHLVALAVAEAVDAELLVLRRYALRILAVDGDELGEVDLAARQGFRELQAQARGGHFRLGLVVGHAEAVLGAQLVVRLAHGTVVGERKAGLQGIDRRPPVGAPLQRVAEHGEGAGLLRISCGALVTDVSGAGSVHRQVVALAVLVGVGCDGEKRAGEADPGIGVAAVGDDGSGKAARSGTRVGAQHALAVTTQLGGVARRKLPVRFEVRLVASAVFLDALMGEGMDCLRLLRHRGRQRKKENECEEEAREQRHGGHPEGLSRNDPNALSAMEMFR